MSSNTLPPLITLEEHFVSPHVLEYLDDQNKNIYNLFPSHLTNKMNNVSTDRISDMDAGKVHLQILSHGPIDAPLSLCKKVNDSLAEAMSNHPGRFAGFATLPMSSPTDAADELERCVKEHNFLGALIENHLQGTFYDDDKFWPVFAKAQELDVPVYIHPTFAADSDANRFAGNYSKEAGFMMSMAGWSWHSETALHILRLWASGLFDKYPKLKIIIGHMGELLPFQIERTARGTKGWNVQNQRDLMTVWRENFWVTTSGMFTLAPFKCLVDISGWDRVMYSVDYPFSSTEMGLEFVNLVKDSGMASEEEFKGFCYGNAEKLFGRKLT